MDVTSAQATIRWVAGLATAAVLVYMSYLSMVDGFTLAWPVILGMLATVVLLMYGSSELNTLIRTWKGRRPPREKKRGDDD